MTDAAPTSADLAGPLSWWGHTWRVLLTLTIGGVAWATIADTQSDRAFVLDAGLGLVSLGLMFFRRRWPVTTAVLTTVLSSFSAFAAGPATLAAVSLATRRRWREIVPVSVLGLACAEVFTTLHPATSEDPRWLSLTFNVVAIGASTAWGMYVGSRRELLWTLRARAERAEAEQEVRADRSRLAERSRIAREMHDVLAHRISQISMRAGALSYRDDLTAAELRECAAVIRDSAHAALTDLRGVLGVLRDDSGEVLDAPQPTYADLASLVEEARHSGQRITYLDEVATDVPVPEAVGRTLYRIVQEGITNARKHAPGAQLDVVLAGTPTDGVGVTLSNPLGFGPTRTPGAGLGLVGLAERTALRGGRLEHGPDGGAFVLRGWIPWAA
ncbi:histidine kinase [soil metagenome]